MKLSIVSLVVISTVSAVKSRVFNLVADTVVVIRACGSNVRDRLSRPTRALALSISYRWGLIYVINIDTMGKATSWWYWNRA